MAKSTLRRSRNSAYLRQSCRCFYCDLLLPPPGHELEFAAKLSIGGKIAKLLQCTAEHLHPKSAGGADVPQNIAAAHQWCNSRRHARPSPLSPDEFKEHVLRRVAQGRWWPPHVRSALINKQ
ncbi:MULTISPECIES: HNH endonuclease [Diaphorobacter]|uniref:HNH endonuclease n=1 Tax=Diaphorobacter nitroreducens TaxID=164759 RepID=A0AAX1WQT7_9BURK|nr:HNH endonuclease [Diaphorobacter nitroreducens]